MVRLRHIIIAGIAWAALLPAWGQQAIRPGLELPQLKITSPQSELPASVDNSESPYFPPIISQYGGSCAQASAIHYLFTYEMNRWLERPVEGKNSNIFSYRWVWNFLNDGSDEGSFASDGLEITRDYGCMTAANFGGNHDEYLYRWTTGYKKYLDAMHYRTRQMTEIDLSTRSGIETLMNYMADKHDGHPGGGIATFSISWKDWGYNSYEGPSETGIDEMINLNGTSGAHAMTLVGYDLGFEYDFDGDSIISDTEKGAFILVNSWGTWWGTKGRAFMPFWYFLTPSDKGGTSDYEKDALCIDVEYYEPQLVLSAKVHYSSRNDLTLSMGSADGAQATSPARNTISRPPIFKGQGGDQYMQGTFFASGLDIEVAIDYTPLMSVLDTMKAPCYLFTVNKSARGKTGSGYVQSVSVHDMRSGQDQVLTKDFSTAEGAVTLGTHCYPVPTKNWVRKSTGRWYRQSVTSASPIDFSYKTDQNASAYSIRTAHGDYATMKVSDYDEKSGTVKIKFTYYDE